jgi:hypothetical protein
VVPPNHTCPHILLPTYLFYLEWHLVIRYACNMVCCTLKLFGITNMASH